MWTRHVRCGAACALVTLISLPCPRARADFVRGDANQDGSINLADVVLQVRALFTGEAAFPCEDAADADDSGDLLITDPIRTLGFLFDDQVLPPPHLGGPGPDPTCDVLGCASTPDPTPAVIINEIHYNHSSADSLEFVELFNRAPYDVDLTGYSFSNGIEYTFPEESTLSAGGFLVVAANPESSIWNRVEVPVLGPYTGRLSDKGERITLDDDRSCLVESVRYNDRSPWPTGADGYGSSLERVDPLAPAGTPHSWRGSIANRGATAGLENSTLGTPPRPLITEVIHLPEAPTSSDRVEIRVTVDIGSTPLTRATLRWQAFAVESTEEAIAELTQIAEQDGTVVLAATIPPQASQHMVRYVVEFGLGDGTQLLFPHASAPSRFYSHFVYDGEVEAKLPVVWLFSRRPNELRGTRSVPSGAAIQEVGSSTALAFDGALISNSENGMKLKFLHGKEYRDDRTLNIIPEGGGGGTGRRAPHMEHLGFTVYRQFGSIAPRVDWARVIDMGNLGRHTQRVLIQQISERFLRMNDLNDEGDLYKLDKNSFQKKTNVDTGMASMAELRLALQRGTPEEKRAAVFERLDLESVRTYSVVGALICNWDGFHNNLYGYFDPSTKAPWKVIPWDLDQVFEPACANFPLTYPLDGRYPGNGRERASDNRFFSQPYHTQPDLDQLYRDEVLAHVQPSAAFTSEAMAPIVDAIETVLLEDLELLEAEIGATQEPRRAQILDAYGAVRGYIQDRVTFLRTPTE